MSQQPCFVKDVNGNQWKDPTLQGDGWCILFDESGFAELVIPHQKGESLDDAKSRAEMLLVNSGVPGTLAPGHYKSSRRIGGKSQYARTFYLYWSGPIPAHLIPKDRYPSTSFDRQMGTRF